MTSVPKRRRCIRGSALTLNVARQLDGPASACAACSPPSSARPTAARHRHQACSAAPAPGSAPRPRRIQGICGSCSATIHAPCNLPAGIPSRRCQCAAISISLPLNQCDTTVLVGRCAPSPRMDPVSSTANVAGCDSQFLDKLYMLISRVICHLPERKTQLERSNTLYNRDNQQE